MKKNSSYNTSPSGDTIDVAIVSGITTQTRGTMPKNSQLNALPCLIGYADNIIQNSHIFNKKYHLKVKQDKLTYYITIQLASILDTSCRYNQFLVFSPAYLNSPLYIS